MSFCKYVWFANIASKFSSFSTFHNTRPFIFECHNNFFSYSRNNKILFFKILKNDFSTTRLIMIDFEFPDKDLNKIKKNTDIIDHAGLKVSPNAVVKGEPIANNPNKYIDSIKSSNHRSARKYTEEDDALIIEFVNIYGYNDLTFERAASELDRYRGKFVKERYDKLMKENGIELPVFEKIKIHRKRKYTEEEDIIIKDYVITHGYSIDTFKKLSIQLSRPRWDSIRDRFEIITNELDVHEDKNDELKSLEIKSRKNFTKEEDRKIIDYVKKFGYNLETFKNLANDLDRKHSYTIRMRHDRITSEKPLTQKVKRDWSLEEEDMLLRYMIKVQLVKHLENKKTCNYLDICKKNFERLTSLDFMILGER